MAVVRQPFAQGLRGPAHLGQRLGRTPFKQHAGLGEVGGDHRGQGQHGLAQLTHRVTLEQGVAALGDHHGVEHQMRQHPIGQRRLKPFGHRPHHRRSAQHADLGRGDRDIGKQRVELLSHECGIGRRDASDRARVLRRQRSDHAATVRPMRGEGAQVGEQPRPA